MANQTDKATIDLVINGRQAETSMVKIKTAAINAQKALHLMAETDPGYKKQEAELRSLLAAQQSRIVKINQEKTAWEKFKAGGANMMAGVVGGNIATFALEKIMQLGPAVVDRQMKIRDSFADIAKAADMSDAEVSALNENLKKLDTRTSTEDLRAIAVVGGQFGIAQKDMEGFVESADKLNVALGDQFDSVEKVAETSLTLRNTFQDIKSDNIADDMMKIGNGLNYLEAQGAATAPVMADFSSRIGGIAIPLGLTSGQVLGLSATLQELNVTSERGSSAVTDILSGITKAPDTFAKYAKGVDGATLSNKQFKELVNTDLNAALMAVIRGFKDGDTSATGMAAKLADMDIKGNGVMEIFMKLATNTDLLTQRQQQSAEALSNTASITGEFSKKNHELAVNLKKLGEWFDGFLENETLGKFASGIVSATVSLLGLNRESGKLTKEFGQQKTQVAALDNQLKPLLEKHDQLSKKSKLSSTEQAELRKVTEQIASIMPGAAVQFDQYGKAIGVSTGKARELLDVQRELLKSMNKGAIAEQQQELRNLAFQQGQLAKKRKSGVEVTVSRNNAGTVDERTLSAGELSELDRQIAAKQQEAAAIAKKIAELEGKASAPAAKPAAKPKNDQFGTAESEEEKKAREKKEKAAERQGKKDNSAALRRAEELEHMLADGRARAADVAGREYEKELLQFGQKYSKMYDLAGSNKDKQAEITTLMYDELAGIEKANQAREYKEAKKHSDEMLRLALKDLEHQKMVALASIQVRIAAKGITKEEGQLAEDKVEAAYLLSKEILYQTHYDALIKLAGDNEKEVTEIKKQQADTQEGIDASQTQSEANQASTRREIRDAEKEHAQEIHRKKMQMAREEKEFRQQMIMDMSALMQTDWTQTLEGYKTYWKEATVVQKIGFLASKGFALAEIGINLARQITLINTAAMLADSFAPGAGVAIRLKGYILAIGSAALSTAKVVAMSGPSIPAFADGGFNVSKKKASGFTNGATYYAGSNMIAGEAGDEWIMSAPMMKNPVMARLAGALQALQVSGQYKNLTLGSSSGGGSAGSGSGGSDPMLMAILVQLQKNQQAIDAYAAKPTQFDFLAHKRLQEDVEQNFTANTL